MSKEPFNPYPKVSNHEFSENWQRVPYAETTDLDVALLRKHVEWVQEDDKRGDAGHDPRDKMWYQADWVKVWNFKTEEGQQICTTACCLAGNVAVSDKAVVQHELSGDYCAKGDEVGYEGKYLAISDYARLRLGLTSAEANELFNGDNTAAEIRDIAEDIVEKRTGERL